jgi:hypothetical protein
MAERPSNIGIKAIELYFPSQVSPPLSDIERMSSSLTLPVR